MSMKTNKKTEALDRYNRWNRNAAMIFLLGIVLAALLSWPIDALLARGREGGILMGLGLASLLCLIIGWAIPRRSSMLRMKVSALAWLGGLMFLALSATAGVIFWILALKGLADGWINDSARWFKLMAYDPMRVLLFYQQWFSAAWKSMLPAPKILIGIAAFGFLLSVLVRKQNPHDALRTLHGNSRLATMKDLKRWKCWRDSYFSKKNTMATNLLDEGGIVLGKFNKRYLQSNTTLTALVLAAPGSGKTSGIAIPTILNKHMRDWSFFIFDIKGELYEETAGYRSECSAVLRFEPRGRHGARWNPLSPTHSLPDGGKLKATMDQLDSALAKIFGDYALDARVKLLQEISHNNDWQNWIQEAPHELAPIAHSSAPIRKIMKEEVGPLTREISIMQADRENYLQKLVFGLVPEPEGGAGKNKHFIDRGRAAGFALMGYTIAYCEEQGYEPNFGRLIDLWSNAVEAHGGGNTGDQKQEGSAIDGALQAMISRCNENGYPERVRQELISLKNTPDEERGSIFSTLDNGLAIFKQQTIRDRTSTSDFRLDDMRGMKGADGKQYPVTLYVTVSLEDIKPLAPIMVMLTEAMQSRLISQPAAFAKKARKVLFLLDEFAQLPKMSTLLSGPAVGRGQRVGNLLIAQSYGQIRETYGADGLKALLDTTEWKVILPLSDGSTAKEISEMIGNQTVFEQSESSHRVRPFGILGEMVFGLFDSFTDNNNQAKHNDVNESRSLKPKPVFSPSDLMSSDTDGAWREGQQIVMAYRRYNRPIVCDTPFYFKDKEVLQRSKIPAPFPSESQPENGQGFCGKLVHLRVKPANDAKKETVSLQQAA